MYVNLKKSHTFRHNKYTSQQYSFKTSLVNLKKNGMMKMCFPCDYWKGGVKLGPHP